MRIALIGTHNSGKTTLFNLMKKDKMFKDYKFVGELVRELNNKGFGINETAGDDTQLALAFLNMYHSFQMYGCDRRKGLVMDRCLLDNYIYAKYLQEIGKVSKRVIDVIEPLVNESLYCFDYLFLCSPEFEMKDDGIRDNNKDFQMKIHEMFEDYIKNKMDCEYKVRTLSGSSKNRLQFIKNLEFIDTMGY